ncbi:MAG: SPOR domain-containing protein [Fibrobacteria bacterium]|nr:SPOR domain-containing protein [Fibrobacteria bacterium]
MIRILLLSCLMGLLGANFSGCNKKQEPPVIDDEPFGEDTGLLEEPELETVEEALLEEEELLQQESDPGLIEKKPEKKLIKKKPLRKSSRVSQEGISPNGKYVIQLSIFKSRGPANALRDKLKAKGYPAYISDVQSPVPDMPGTHYRVRVGNFSTLEIARNFGEANFRPDGYDFWVDFKHRDSKGASSAAVKKTAPPAKKVAPAPVKKSAPVVKEEAVPPKKAAVIPKKPDTPVKKSVPAPSPQVKPKSEPVKDAGASIDDAWDESGDDAEGKTEGKTGGEAEGDDWGAEDDEW